MYSIYTYCNIFLIFQGELITVARNHETMIDLDLRYLNNGRNTSGKKEEKTVQCEYIKIHTTNNWYFYFNIIIFIKIGTRSIVKLKMFGPFVSKTSKFEHLYRVKQLLVTVGDDKEGHINKTITDALILGTLLIIL